MENIMLPMGVRRDGSYYTRIEWAAVTESDPTFWVCNVISDDHERNGGTYGACFIPWVETSEIKIYP